MFSGPPITRSYLQGLARNATTDFLANGTPLTEAVVKQASAVDATLTAEHVRRICEMTYHDTYERMHKQAGSADRYVVFDPPDPCVAAEMLSAEKVASARPRNPSLSGSLMTEKTASAPRRAKFQAANAFDELMKTASTTHDDAYEGKKLASQVQRLDSDLREAAATLRVEIETVKTAEMLAWGELTKVAYSTYKDGHSLEEVLHAGFSGLREPAAYHSASIKVASHLAEFLAGKLEKTAGLQLHHTQRLGEIDPEHPLPRRFNKMAALATQRAHMEIALGDLQRDRQFLNDEISETLFGDKTASIRLISTVPYRGS